MGVAGDFGEEDTVLVGGVGGWVMYSTVGVVGDRLAAWLGFGWVRAVGFSVG